MIMERQGAAALIRRSSFSAWHWRPKARQLPLTASTRWRVQPYAVSHRVT